MTEENIVRYTLETTPDESPPDWEEEIKDAPHDPPRKTVWIPMDYQTTHWYMTQEQGIHNSVNSVLREYMEVEITRQQDDAGQE